MSKLIPLNSLILTVGPTQAVNHSCVKNLFSDYEIISVEKIREELTGDSARLDIDSVVFGEIYHRVQVKLKLGERVCVVAPNLKTQPRLGLAEVGASFGVPVFYLICADPSAPDFYRLKFEATETDAMRGDGIAEVVDFRSSTATVVKKYDRLNMLPQIKDKYDGITVIGDVHGMHQSLLTTIEWAISRNHFVLSLGDVIDYGPASLETADEIYRLVMRGKGELILGNHERKIAKWLDNNERGRAMMSLSDGNKVTTSALQQAGSRLRDRWSARFRGMVSRSPINLSMGSYHFAHAAVHPSKWDNAQPMDARTAENFALFGEYDTPIGQARPRRTYNWVQAIPEGQTVIVGHDARSSLKPFVEENEQGGKAIFLDTGAGKGGPLSSVDLRFNAVGELEIKNYLVI